MNQEDQPSNPQKLRPLQGQVLVHVKNPPTETASGLGLPDKQKLKDEIGREPLREAVVLRLGIWAQNRKGRLIPYEFKVGNRVFVDPVLGKQVRRRPHLRLYDHTQILGLVVDTPVENAKALAVC